jgi:UDP-N-acetyl-2-amino-2-deoxyglucuronate dehydrogenase
VGTPLKAGIIGFGMAGRNMHYKALVEGCADLATVAAVCTRHPISRGGDAPGDMPLAPDVAWYDDPAAFLAHTGLDVVHVCTPSGAHGRYIRDAAAAGKHVVCDKPLEVTLDEADAAIGACRDNGTALSVSFQQRFNPHIARLRELISDGVLGRIVAGEVSCRLYRDSAYYDPSGWKGTLALDGGGALMNQGIHYLDLLLWLVDSPVVEITGGAAERLVHDGIEAEDFAAGELVHGNGAVSTVTVGTCFRPGFDQRLEIRGTHGWVAVANGVITGACWDGEDRRGLFGEVELVAASGSSPAVGLDNHVRYFRAVYESLAAGTAVPVPGTEARIATEVVLGIYRAAETDARVRLPLDQGYRPRFPGTAVGG